MLWPVCDASNANIKIFDCMQNLAASPCTLCCLLCSTYKAAANAMDSWQLPDDLQFTPNSVGAPLNFAVPDADADAAAAAAAISDRLLYRQANITCQLATSPGHEKCRCG